MERRPILVVDDDEAILSAVESTLADEGYPVVTAPDGAAALDVVERQQPTAILLDMKMPVMDGWAFARAYRQQPGPRAHCRDDGGGCRPARGRYRRRRVPGQAVRPG